MFDFGAFQKEMYMPSRAKYLLHILFGAFQVTPRINDFWDFYTLPWNSKICSSLVVTHESWVPFCFGIRQWVMVNSPPSWPKRIPQVSIFLELFSLATFRNCLDNEIGILIFVSEEEIEEGDSIIFSWSDTVAKNKISISRILKTRVVHGFRIFFLGNFFQYLPVGD